MTHTRHPVEQKLSPVFAFAEVRRGRLEFGPGEVPRFPDGELPLVAPGMVRTSVVAIASPDQTVVDYVLIDEEVSGVY